MTEAADPDGVSKEIVPESSEKPQDTQVKRRRRSVLRVSQLLLRAIAAHKGLTLTMLKKEFGNAGYQVGRKCSDHSSLGPKPASVKGTLLRVSGSKAEGFFRVWKSLKPIKKRTKRRSAEIEEVNQNCFESLFARRYRKPPEEDSQPSPGDSFKPETPEGPETPDLYDLSETPHSSEEKIYVEQVNENPEDMEEVALSLVPGYSMSQKASKKTREEMGPKAKQRKIKKMKMKEKSKDQLRSTEGSKRPKTKKGKKMRIKENRGETVNEDKKTKPKEKTREKVRERNVDPEKQVKHKQNRQNCCQRYSPNLNLASAKSSKIHGGNMKALDRRTRRPYKISPRKDSSRKESAQGIESILKRRECDLTESISPHFTCALSVCFFSVFSRLFTSAGEPPAPGLRQTFSLIFKGHISLFRQ
ncbi:testis-specific H1 histone [Vombatus ursinus]|uniref:testis-specific H1 histone n=1 Tax=Vombatus ursinus TaxID=29139 RepID=UPI000FFD6C98|nr:testis-specific H1 histone [Vombatus ursinus]